MSEPIEWVELSPEEAELLNKPLKRREIPQRINMSDVPQVIKDAMWIVDWKKTFAHIIESDPDVQEQLGLMDSILSTPEESTVIKNSKWPQLWIKQEALEKRNNTIVDYCTMGMTYKTILRNINARNEIEQRGYIENEWSIRRIVSDYYRSIKPRASEDLSAIEDAMREAAYAAQDRAIEKLALTLKKTGKFKSDFERAIAIEKLIQAHQLRIENRWWNKTRATPFSAQQNNTHINIINQHVNNVVIEGSKEGSVKSLLGELDKLLDT